MHLTCSFDSVVAKSRLFEQAMGRLILDCRRLRLHILTVVSLVSPMSSRLHSTKRPTKPTAPAIPIPTTLVSAAAPPEDVLLAAVAPPPLDEVVLPVSIAPLPPVIIDEESVASESPEEVISLESPVVVALASTPR